MRRLHRLRSTPGRRALFAEHRLDPAALCLPIFVHSSEHSEAIEALPGVARQSVSDAAVLAKDALSRGIKSVLVFGVPSVKDARGASASDVNGPAAQAVRAIKDSVGDEMVVLSDTCLCSYTSDGHCCLYKSDGDIDLAGTWDALANAAVSQAEAGADMVAPSGMMDGHVAAIRTALDDHGHEMTGLVSYAAKQASAFYGPFREAADSGFTHGDRRGYQIDPAAGRQSMASIETDLQQGADAVIVKPAITCLDLIAEARARFSAPVWAYQVSGEYAMMRSGVVDEQSAILESLISIRRAGADVIITYAAMDAAAWLDGGK